MIVIEFDFEHPVAVTVSVRLYTVVTEGDTDGFDVVEVKPEGVLVHAYVFPVTAVPPIVVEEPAQRPALVPALAAGRGLTVTTTEFDFKQPVVELVSVTV